MDINAYWGGYMKKKNHSVFKAIIFLLCCIIVFIFTKHYYTKKISSIKNGNTIIEKTVELSGETIQSKMASIGKLATAEYTYTHVEHFDSSRTIGDFKIPLTKSSFIYSYDGSITAGIDFSKIKVEKNNSKKSISIILPAPEIISSEIDQNSFKLYDEKKNIFNPINVTDVVSSISDLQTTEEQNAIDKGLLDKAKSNATTLIDNYMTSFDIPKYTINISFEESSDEKTDAQ